MKTEERRIARTVTRWVSRLSSPCPRGSSDRVVSRTRPGGRSRGWHAGQVSCAGRSCQLVENTAEIYRRPRPLRRRHARLIHDAAKKLSLAAVSRNGAYLDCVSLFAHACTVFNAAVDAILTCVGGIVTSLVKWCGCWLKFGLKCDEIDRFNGTFQRYEFKWY